MQFEFATANKIIFGPGTLKTIGAIANEMGKRALVVTGFNLDRAKRLLDLLTENEITYETYSVADEPTIEVAREGVSKARAAGCDFIIGFGGGSAIDTGKAISALLTNPGDPLDYLEVIGKGQPLKYPAAPYIAIPTTAGTGSEVTRNAVLASTEKQVKVSLRSALMIPRVALVDPELTYGMPKEITASTGLDALTQVLEPYVCNKPTPMTDALCKEAMSRAARSLQKAYASDDHAARQDMALVSLFGGLALANAKLGAVHGFAAPIGGTFHAPHGAVCARLLPYVMEANVHALHLRQPDSEPLWRYDEVARILTGNPNATASDGVDWAHELCLSLNVPPLSSYGMKAADIPSVVEKAAVASSMQGNPIKLTTEEMTQILTEAL
jgi:alcohol dehydrogenase class IV